MLQTDSLRVRNKGIRLVRVADIEDAPWNYRDHPEQQQQALAGSISELGFFGYPDCWEPAPGRIQLCDGHLRKDLLLKQYGQDAEIEVNVTDFDEMEAKKATLIKDPVTAMAETNAANLDALLREVETGSQALADMLSGLAEQAGIVPEADKETELKQLDVKPPPKMSWVLLGIPTVRFGEIAADVERLATLATICETTVNDG